jgi:[acyl-carrier-protein] S-malonyltransferase
VSSSTPAKTINDIIMAHITVQSVTSVLEDPPIGRHLPHRDFGDADAVVDALRPSPNNATTVIEKPSTKFPLHYNKLSLFGITSQQENMVRFVCSSMLLLAATRLSSAFVPAVRSFARTATSVAATSDNDFDDFTAKVAFMFPGQGAQFVGMCGDVVKDVPAAKALFDEASEILGYDLLEVCTEGPKEKLDSTVISQPAIFVASMAAVEKLRQEEGQEAIDAATCAMGLSLGEYSALCFAGALSFADGVKITKARGEAMQAASDAVDSGMVSVIGLDSDKVKELCAAASEKSGEKVQIANYLCKGNYAVSGASAACDVVGEIAKPDFKARMTVKLAVAGAFHTGKYKTVSSSRKSSWYLF